MPESFDLTPGEMEFLATGQGDLYNPNTGGNLPPTPTQQQSRPAPQQSQAFQAPIQPQQPQGQTQTPSIGSMFGEQQASQAQGTTIPGQGQPQNPAALSSDDAGGVSPQDHENLGNGDGYLDAGGFDLSYEGASDYDARDVYNYLPEERVNSEFPFELHENARYRSWDDAVKGTEERLKYIDSLKEEREGLSAQLQEALGQVQRLNSDLESAKQLVGNGKSEIDIDRMMARKLLPDDLREIDPKTLNVSMNDFIQPWDEFLTEYGAKHKPAQNDYDTTSEYRDAMADFHQEASRKFAEKNARAEKSFRTKLGSTESTRIQYERAMTEAIAKVRSERETRIERERLQQEQAAHRVEEMRTYLQGEVSADKLVFNNVEDEHRAIQLLQTKVPVYQGDAGEEQLLSEVMVLVGAAFGQEPVRLMLDGMKSRINGSQTAQPRRARPNHRPRASQMTQVPTRGRRRAQQQSTEDMFREALPGAYG